ncbi:Ribosome association toxin RatA [hydrothermal vent metagenome]|uniref:Ribosome association toxin RatA n=1 Tax=hydrothermal vent metagenome TaxID=652676 RepID=A0A3B0Z9D2_9ZZZZ
MQTISRSALVPYSASEMFSLVDNIIAYPEFLPWCSKSNEIERDTDEVYASIEINKGVLRKSFSTCNRIQKNKMIEMRLKEGPFKYLQGFWRFDQLGDEGCRISFDLQFEFSNRLLGMTVGPIFSQIANSMVDAFNQRAHQIYGKR